MSEIKEIPADIKNDIKLAFDLYKNENNKINKLKLRTLLFSFVMYKSSPSDINEYIDSKTTNEKELYSFDDVCDLINEKLEEAKEKDADELYDYIVNNKNDNSKITKRQIKNAFESCNIDLDEKEIDKMIDFMKHKKKNGEGEKEKENKEIKENKENQESKENKESKESKESKENKENKENPELKKKKSTKENINITRGEFKEFYVEQK